MDRATRGIPQGVMVPKLGQVSASRDVNGSNQGPDPLNMFTAKKEVVLVLSLRT
jgi:hypothetical protein